MKLISCHIDGFGSMVNFDIAFHEGMNGILERNGWGKSTLAAFIKVMLFGFDCETKRDPSVNERKRFRPWKADAPYGGRLVFEAGGKEYRIERSFGEKKSEDGFRIYDVRTELPSEDFGTEVGEALFEIDSGSFKRTVFVGQNDQRTETTPKINAKIGNISDQVEDIGILDEVEEKLKKELNLLTPDRATGELKKIGLRMDELYGSKGRAERKEEEILKKEELLSKLKKERLVAEEDLQKVQREIAACSKFNENRGKFTKRTALLEVKERAEREEKKIRGRFRGEVPSLAEVEEYERLALEAEAKKQRWKEIAITDYEKERSTYFERRFGAGIPDEEEIAKLDGKIRFFRELKNRGEGIKLSEEEEEKRRKTEERFGRYQPTEDEMEAYMEKWSQRDVKNASLSANRNNVRLFKLAYGKNASKLSLVCLILGMISTLTGVGIFFIHDEVYIGLGLAVAGLLLILLSIFFDKSKKTDPEEPKQEKDLKRMIKEDEAFIKDTEKEIRDFFEKMGISYEDRSVTEELFKIRNELREYESLKRRHESMTAGGEEERKEEIRAEFAKFGLPDLPEHEFEAAVKELAFDRLEYEKLKNKENRHRMMEKELEEAETVLREYFKKLGMDEPEDKATALRGLRTDIIVLEEQISDVKDAKELLREFEEANADIDFDAPDDLEGEKDIDALNETFDLKKREVSACLQKIGTLEKELSEDESILQEFREDAEELERLGREKERKRKRYEIVLKTKEYLEKAKANFLSKYMNPVKSAFDKYYGMMEDDGKEFLLDAKLNFSLREEGEKRDPELLSEGNKNLVNLCRRLAMVDVMYKEEKPFLIFDDPFVNFDKEHLERSVDFLKKLSEDYQIIYLYCHESREV